MQSLPLPESLKWLVLAISGYIVYSFLYPFVFSPLRHIPGPWYARFSKLWIIYKTVQGVRAKSIHELHLKYGPWVIIGPDEVSISDQDAIVPIYGATSKFVKTTFYTYQLRGIPELFTMSNQKQHADRRRLLAHLFSMSTMKDYEPVISDNVKLCMDLVAEQGRQTQASNLYDWFHYLSMDIICELSFGRTFNMLREGMNSTYIQDMYQSLEIEPVRYHFAFLNRYAGWAPLKWVRDSETASVRSFKKGVRMVQEYKQDPEKKRAKDLLRKMLDARDEAGNALPEDELNVEATGLILAGSHTTSSSLTWIVWRLLRHPDIMDRLTKELDDALSQCPRDAIPLHHHLEHLTYFNAVIKEGLRIDTAVPGSTPRYVPYGGAEISGHYLPGGATVSIQAYSTHRDPDVFPNPEVFDPDRWLAETPEMRRMYIPFGADGPRKCIGIHLAYVELRVILASLLHRFDLSLIEQEDTDKAMDMHELWLAAPEGQKLHVFAKEKPANV